jgi:hypothetical protein
MQDAKLVTTQMSIRNSFYDKYSSKAHSIQFLVLFALDKFGEVHYKKCSKHTLGALGDLSSWSSLKLQSH